MNRLWVLVVLVLATGFGGGAAMMQLFEGDRDPGRASAPEAFQEAPAPVSVQEDVSMVSRSDPATATVEPEGPDRPSAIAITPSRPEERTVALAPPTGLVRIEGRPRIAVIIDDVGLNADLAAQATALPAPVTLAFLPYADGLGRMTADAHAAGHEIFLHMPMEPASDEVDPGPGALLSSLTPAELDSRIAADLGRVPGAIGVNNHMGSKLTADRVAMGRVMAAMKANGLVFVDSRTTAATVAETVAQELGVPHTRRDVFLDNDRDAARIHARLAELEARAREAGSAVGIGHPYPETLAALAAWLPDVTKRGLVIVRASSLAGLDESAAVARHAE